MNQGLQTATNQKSNVVLGGSSYEQDLERLRNAQREAAVADIERQRNEALSNLQAEEARIKPEYAAQRSTANANNRVAARNFQEYLANTGRANSGIGAQYEMSRQNSLQNGLNAINAAEAQSVADIARRRTDAQNAYNTGLAGVNAQVEADYINNLLQQRQQQWERDFAQKQFDESVRQFNLNRQDNLRKLYSSSSGGSSSKSSSSSSKKTTTNNTNNTSTIEAQNQAVYNAAKPGERYVKQVKTAQGGYASQLWMKTANGKDYRIA